MSGVVSVVVGLVLFVVLPLVRAIRVARGHAEPLAPAWGSRMRVHGLAPGIADDGVGGVALSDCSGYLGCHAAGHDGGHC